MQIAPIESTTPKSVPESVRVAPTRKALGRRETLTNWLLVVVAVVGTVLNLFLEWP
jgi:hypothetical protein